MDAKTKVQEWVDHQVAVFAANQAGDTAEAERHIAASSTIEHELREAGRDIRQLVCPR